MPFTAITDPKQRAILISVLDDVCLAMGCGPDGLERDDVADLVMQFYGRGCRTAAELKKALEKAISQEQFG